MIKTKLHLYLDREVVFVDLRFYTSLHKGHQLIAKHDEI